MKKLLSGILVILMMLSIGTCACAESLEGLLNSLKNELQQEQKQEKKKECQQPLDGVLFNDLGQQQLYKNSFRFQNRQFRVYLFPVVSERITNEIVFTNQNEHFFEHEVFVEDGVTYNILKQYGDDGKWAVVTGDFLGYTMVMIENDLTVENFHFVQQCTLCGGDGDCNQCTNGKCTACNGKGYSTCVSCKGSGIHDFCEGLGFRGGEWLFDGYITPVRDCSCDNGKCPLCNGTGLGGFKCTKCYATKVCTTCQGSHDCQRCGGDGVR